MYHEIDITPTARRQFGTLPVRERNTVRIAMDARLRHTPTQPTRAIKQLRPNAMATFELRVGDLRVLYDVEDSVVQVKAVGRKVGDQLMIEGEVFDGLRDDPPEPPGGEPTGNIG